MVTQTNPFALARASDYTDAQINDLWVELGTGVINTVIDPRSGTSRYILGGKGTGKTHLLRYHSYQVARLRAPLEAGVATILRHGYLAVFLRATALDAARFEATSALEPKWQQLFGVYLELRLAEGVLDALCEVKASSPDSDFDDALFIEEVAKSVTDQAVGSLRSITDFHNWLVSERRRIDEAVNNAAFMGELDIRVPFSIGSLCLPIKKAISKWHTGLGGIPLIYMLDEIENLSVGQQQVVNTLIRYSEQNATFRITGRLYAKKTLAVIGGEENREGAEFTTIDLDGLLKSVPNYTKFAKKFVLKRLLAVKKGEILPGFDPQSCFEQIDSENFFSKAIQSFGLDPIDLGFVRRLVDALSRNRSGAGVELAETVGSILIDGLPIVLQRLNVVRFCKRYKRGLDPRSIAEIVREDSEKFRVGGSKGSYSNAYSHYKWDIFAQLCRDSPKVGRALYGGFDNFVKMSSGVPRNLLIVLGRAYEIASFREIDFFRGDALSVELQTEAAVEAARFMYERDTNYGSPSDLARVAVERIASVLRTARYSLSIPEVSPLAVSFLSDGLTNEAQKVLASSLNYSFVFEISDGRPDRNTERVNRKIQLNPMLAPKWGLPIGRRGDLSLSSELVNSIFDPARGGEFQDYLNELQQRWNNPFGRSGMAPAQGRLV